MQPVLRRIFSPSVAGEGGGGVTDHGALTGLGDDDHPQYSLVSVVDAKGDLIVATASDAVSRLAVGTNDQILMADSAEATGLKWAGPGTPVTQAFGDVATAGSVDFYSRGNHVHGMPEDPVIAHEADADPHSGYLREATTIDFLVGTGTGELAGEIAVGATPNGELGGTWDAITVDASHSGSTHAAAQAAAEATAAAALAGHEAAADPHAGYQLESGKGAANGYAGLDAGSLVPRAQLGTGTADGTTVLFGDGTWQEPGAASHPNLASHESLGLVTDADLTAHEAAVDPHTGYLKESQAIGFLVTAASPNLASEIVVGTEPNGELGGTWEAITVDASHSGSSHAATQAAAEGTAAAALASHAGNEPLHFRAIPFMVWSKEGEPVVGVSPQRLYVKGDWTMVRVDYNCGTSVALNNRATIRKNGVDVLSSKPNLNNVNHAASTAFGGNENVTEDDYLQAEVTLVNAGIADVNVVVWMEPR